MISEFYFLKYNSDHVLLRYELVLISCRVSYILKVKSVWRI